MTEDNIDNRMEEATASPAAPDLPDHLVNPNAVIVDEGVEWRYGKPPDYSKTRKEWARSKCLMTSSRYHRQAAMPASQHPLLLTTCLPRVHHFWGFPTGFGLSHYQAWSNHYR